MNDAADDQRFTDEWERWHARHEAKRADRHGFLAITSINWLNDSSQRFTDAPGEWRTDASGVHVDLAEGEEIVVDGRPVSGSYDVGVVPEGEGVFVGWGDASIEIAKRGGHDIVRPRHPGSPVLAAYRGTPTYPPQERWAVPARFVPFDAPKPAAVGAVVEGMELLFESPGTVEFALDGHALSLVVFTDPPGDGLWVLFRDTTSGVTTYAACRSLHTAAPAADGSVVLDFNRATNLPCAYTTFATCPLPPPENHLPIAVEAGEQLPR
ncbi:MAG: DUF1684 domain-containing protein [Actinobacteria bacterium]|nr:DUF1684 domain-containing protein [Actinomycetota bacterium]